MSKVQGNLTEGLIFRVLTKLAIPIMASSFLGTAYSIMDMAWIGQLGSKAVAGVGVGGMYVWLSHGLAALARTGGQIHVAQSIGKGETETAKKYTTASVWLATVLGLLFGAICLCFTNPLVSFFQLDDASSIVSAKEYLRITCGCSIFSFLGIVLTGLYTAQGDSKTPLKANFIGLVFNMILDPLLILGVGPFPRLEAKGAAIATVFSQFIVVLVLVIMIWKKGKESNLLYGSHMWRVPKRKYIGHIFKMGGPASLQSMLYCMFSMVLSRMVSGFDDGAIATQRVGGQIESLSWNTAEGFASATNAFTAQNYGAGKMDRVKKGYNLSSGTMFVWGTFVAVVFLIFPESISRIFFHEADVIAMSVNYLRIIGIGEGFMCLELVAIGAISGLGNTKLCSAISICLTGLRIPLAYVLSRTALALNGIWWALTLTSMAKGVVLHLAFQKEHKNKSLNA